MTHNAFTSPAIDRCEFQLTCRSKSQNHRPKLRAQSKHKSAEYLSANSCNCSAVGIKCRPLSVRDITHNRLRVCEGTELKLDVTQYESTPALRKLIVSPVINPCCLGCSAWHFSSVFRTLAACPDVQIPAIKVQCPCANNHSPKKTAFHFPCVCDVTRGIVRYGTTRLLR